MARHSALDDLKHRNRVLRVIKDGGTIEDAAEEIGTTVRSINRYASKNHEYRDAIEAARAFADRRSAVVASRLRPPPKPKPPPPTPPPPDPIVLPKPPPSDGQTTVSAALGIDVDLIQDIDADVGDSEDLTDDKDGLPPLTVESYMELCWKRAREDTKQAPVWARLIQEVTLGPAVRAQVRRETHIYQAEQRAIRAEQPQSDDDAVDVEVVDGKSGGGMLIIAIPPNGTEAPGYEPAARSGVIEAEVCE